MYKSELDVGSTKKNQFFHSISNYPNTNEYGNAFMQFEQTWLRSGNVRFQFATEMIK